MNNIHVYIKSIHYVVKPTRSDKGNVYAWKKTHKRHVMDTNNKIAYLAILVSVNALLVIDGFCVANNDADCACAWFDERDDV